MLVKIKYSLVCLQPTFRMCHGIILLRSLGYIWLKIALHHSKRVPMVQITGNATFPFASILKCCMEIIVAWHTECYIRNQKPNEKPECLYRDSSLTRLCKSARHIQNIGPKEFQERTRLCYGLTVFVLVNS